MRRKAFTLIEILTAITIIVLLSAIIFPVLARARLSGYRAESIAYLRQVGTAIELYRGDHDGQHGYRQLDPVVETGYLRTPRLLVSHTDAFDQGYGRAVSDCIDKVTATKLNTSYETALFSKTFYDHLMSVDPNAAIVVDRTHGEVMRVQEGSCEGLLLHYSGRILRLYEDTSVAIQRFSVVDWDASPTSGLIWRRYRLYTDFNVKLTQP